MLDAVHDGSRRQAGVLLLQGKKGRPRDFGGCESLVAQQIPFNHSSLGTWSPDLFLPKDPGVRPYPRFLVPHVAQMVKNLPAMWKSWVRSLGWEDPPEKEMATHSSILAWRIPWTEEPGRLQSMGSQSQTHFQFSPSFQGSLLQTSSYPLPGA